MTPDHTSKELIELLNSAELTGRSPEALVTTARSAPYQMWRDAEDDAREAYESWRQSPSVDGYVAYLAAEDRAAAAQTALARWSQASHAFA